MSPSEPVVGFFRRARMAMVKAKMKNPEVTRTAGIITLREEPHIFIRTLE